MKNTFSRLTLTLRSRCALVLAIISLFAVSCVHRVKYEPEPQTQGVYQSLTIRVKITLEKERKKQSFKIVLKYDGNRDKMLFFSPLNQIYGQLLVEKEKALFINTVKKRYWEGSFNTLIREIWNLDFHYLEFKKMVVSGIIPQKKARAGGYHISLEKEKNSNKPKGIIINGKDLTIQLKISRRKTVNGVIRFHPRLQKLKPADIESVISDK